MSGGNEGIYAFVLLFCSETLISTTVAIVVIHEPNRLPDSCLASVWNSGSAHVVIFPFSSWTCQRTGRMGFSSWDTWGRLRRMSGKCAEFTVESHRTVAQILHCRHWNGHHQVRQARLRFALRGHVTRNYYNLLINRLLERACCYQTLQVAALSFRPCYCYYVALPSRPH